jgi:hypothetical protein
MDPTSLDDLELQLRKLPGVRAAGFTERDDMLVVQVQVTDDQPGTAISREAARIAYRHTGKPVALEVVRWKTVAPPAGAPTAIEGAAIEGVNGSGPGADAGAQPEPGEPAPPVPDDAPTGRVRLLAVLTFPDTDELEVHLTHGGRRAIGRAHASTGVTGAVQATVDALLSFVPDLDADVVWAEELAGHGAVHASVVTCAIQLPTGPALGIAAGNSRIEAAARAGLHALNRLLGRHPVATA